MKQRNFLATVIVAAGMSLFLYSCNGSGEGEKTAETKPEAEAPKAAEVTPAVVMPSNFLIIKHKVANYAKWQPVFDANDSIKLANGLTNYVVGRGTGSDSNTLLVAFKMADVNKAKALSASPELKSRMQKSGVISQPTFNYVETVMMDTATNTSTVRLIVMHKVKDWDAWKKEFDMHKQTRMDAGLTDRAVGHEAGDTHMVTLVFAVSDMAKAKAFTTSKDLKDKMMTAGVEGPPTMFFYNEVKKY